MNNITIFSIMRRSVMYSSLLLFVACDGSADYSALLDAARSAQESINNFSSGRGYGLNSLQEFVNESIEMAEAGLISQEKVDETVNDLQEWSQWFDDELFRSPMLPVSLLDSGPNVVSPPRGVHPFYKKYLNAYNEDYTKGIPIIASHKVDDRAMLKIRSTILKMLSKRPDVRDAMVANKERIVVRAVLEESWNHPEFRFGTEGGGSKPSFPSTLIEEEGIYYLTEYGEVQPRFYHGRFMGRYLIVEEFLHSMQRMGMPFVEDGVNIQKEIESAYINAVKTGAFDSEAFYDESISGTDRVPLTDPSRQSELESYLTEQHIRRINGEYLAISAELFFYGTVPTGDPKAKNREELKQYDPVVYNILTRYFYEDDWHPYK